MIRILSVFLTVLCLTLLTLGLWFDFPGGYEKDLAARRVGAWTAYRQSQDRLKQKFGPVIQQAMLADGSDGLPQTLDEIQIIEAKERDAAAFRLFWRNAFGIASAVTAVMALTALVVSSLPGYRRQGLLQR